MNYVVNDFSIRATKEQPLSIRIQSPSDLDKIAIRAVFKQILVAWIGSFVDIGTNDSCRLMDEDMYRKFHFDAFFIYCNSITFFDLRLRRCNSRTIQKYFSCLEELFYLSTRNDT
jgi:hypothetical protein